MNIREIILDTETTGLSPKDGHRIVEIGALEMVNKVLTGKQFHYYINPQRSMPNEAYRVHGISEEFLKDKPLFQDVVEDFLEFINEGSLVIHNAPFDIKFLNHELSLVNKAPLELLNAIDTLPMARKKFPGARASLDALCKRFKVDNSARQLHGALKDAELLAGVYVELTGGRQTSFSLQGIAVEENMEGLLINVAVGNKLVIHPTNEEKKLHGVFLKKFCS
jgi:DNA polymerase-3 subunit epsilon